jgi:GNAT superfamily N-acetyltransferase
MTTSSNGAPPPAGDALFEVIDDASAAACFPIIQQLRPQLADVGTWLTRFHRQVESGYRVFVLKRDDRPLAFAGFRVQENLVYGKFLYVDDLVTDKMVRGGGSGAALIEALKAEARRCGCATLVLDTAIDNALAHRFYYRCGLLARALRFNARLDG